MNVVDEAKAYGCHDVVRFDSEPTPRHLEYLDLLKLSGNESFKVDAVAEFQARPLLYIVSGDQIRNSDPEKRLGLQCLLANRGEIAYLGVLNPGELVVYPINLDRSALVGSTGKTIKRETPEAPLFFQRIINGVFSLEGQPKEADFVFKRINDLMTHSSEDLIGTYGLNPLDVLSFLGRALFFRFLWDRKIVRQNELHTVCPNANSSGDCFRDVENSVATCQWLDETFNGDLLPLKGDYKELFNQANLKTGGRVFLDLRAILEGWEHVGALFQTTIDWGNLDFAHIPIGVLSQVYENFSKIWDPQNRKQTSAYYTPKNIAQYLVDDAFDGLSNKKDARILDPSCGAGIFLVLAFRKLFAARWEHDGKRPDTRTIQSILYTQLCGFDVNESALRLAALSLYITAIELNGTQRPPKSLRFPKPLQGAALHNFRRPEEQEARGFVLGSLSPDLPKGFDGCFDIVIGNPPWGRLKGDDEKSKKLVRKHNVAFTCLTRQALSDRGLGGLAKSYRNPGNNPDLPFLWKATQWAKPEGIIAMVLPGRIFLKQTEPGVKAFEAILNGIEITGILNGSNLSDTAVWPDMSQPFMLLFARNRMPAANHYFYFVTPHLERSLNDMGRLRIDYQSAQPVAALGAIEHSWLLKTLAVGTSLDAEVVRKLDERKWPTVKSYWDSKGLYSGLGYNRSLNLPQDDADFMRKLPDFTPPLNGEFAVDVTMLREFGHSTAHRPRDPKLYTPPLLIVPQSPGPFSTSAKSYLVHKPAVFSQSYYGFSAFGLSNASPIYLLYLLMHSELFTYHVLMTSSRMAAERRTFLKDNIENFPFPPIHLLSESQRRRAENLSIQLETAFSKPWKAINDFIFGLYDIDEHDRQVVKDTLEVAAPFKEARDRANRPPKKDERNAFYAELHQLLTPSFDLTNEPLAVNEVEVEKKGFQSPWHFFSVSSPTGSPVSTQAAQDHLISLITKQANRTGCSRVIVHGTGYLLVGIIGQYRYWTLSRARLCALDILRQHLDAFPVRRS